MKLIIKVILCLVLTSNILAQSVSAKTIVDEAAEQYVQLVLALGVHDAAYVDAYYGPKAWQEQAQKNKIDLKKIVIATKVIEDVLAAEKADDEMAQLRLSYLKSQIRALSSRALMLIGHVQYDFDQQSKALYDTQAPNYALSEFEPAIKQLEALLPGDAPLSKRLEDFQSQFVIPQDKLKSVFDFAIKACRERTKPFVDLLEKENFTLEFVTDKPWSGYNWYKGDGYSLIQVNAELPISISRAIDLGCHEGYPGHHTYNSLLESNLYLKRGWVEYSVYALFSPQSLIAEGSANYGIEMAFPGNQKAEFEKELLFPMAGLDQAKADQYHQVVKLLNKVNYAGNEVARLYLNKAIDAEKAAKMLQRYALMSEKKAIQRVSFFDTYGAYVINYNWGKDLVKQWVEAGSDQSQTGRWKRFAKLLSSPRLPSTLN
jgi:hypothetical protein